MFEQLNRVALSDGPCREIKLHGTLFHETTSLRSVVAQMVKMGLCMALGRVAIVAVGI